MSASDNVAEELDAAIRERREAGARFAYLHGSQAAGKAASNSDIDVAAWFGQAVDPYDVGARLPGRVDLVVLNAAPLVLAGRIALHGVLLFDDDPPSRVEWEATTRKLYADEAPRRLQAQRDFVLGRQHRG